MPEGTENKPISEDLEEILQDQGYGPDELTNLLTVLHPVDLAELLESLDPDDRLQLFRLMSDERAADVLSAMSQDIRTSIAERLGEQRLSGIVDNLEPDIAADILPAVSGEKETRVLTRVDKEHREDIKTLRRYAPHTAGGLMTTNYVWVSDKASCRQAIEAIQGNIDAETIDYIYVLDMNDRLVGVCSIRMLIHAQPDAPISSIMTHEDLIFVGHSLDQEDVARNVQKYDLKAVPVIDNSFRMLGVVTVDDVIDVIEAEASEDIFKMAGAKIVHPLHDSVYQRVKARLPVLTATVLIQLAIAWTIRGYEAALSRFWLLSAFFPIIMAIGGNVGLQSATLVVRGLATGDLTLSRSLKVIFAELRVGFVIGIFCGAIAGSMAYVMHLGNKEAWDFGLAVFVSMAAGITFAAAFGTFIPFACQRIKVDPAIASGPVITTLNDILSIIIYLSLASLLIL